MELFGPAFHEAAQFKRKVPNPKSLSESHTSLRPSTPSATSSDMPSPVQGPEKLGLIIQTLIERRDQLLQASSVSAGEVGLGLDIQPIPERGQHHVKEALAALRDHHQLLLELVGVVEHEIQAFDQTLAYEHNSSRPAYRVPHEILSRIFEDVCISSSPNSSSKTPVDFASRLAISSSCRHWRQAAIQTSSLWTAWKVSMDPDFYTWMDPLALSEGLARARHRLLNLKVDSGAVLNEDVNAVLCSALERTEILNVFMARNINVDNWLFFRSDTPPLPCLRTFSIRERAGDTGLVRRMLPLDLTMAPGLRACRFETRLSRWRFECSFANPASLIHLCLTGVADSLRVLRHLVECSGLETLVWEGFEPAHPIQAAISWNQVIKLPFLVRLHLSQDTSKFIPFFDTPSLRQLQFSPAAVLSIPVRRIPHLEIMEVQDLRNTGTIFTRRLLGFLSQNLGIHSLSTDRPIHRSVLEALGSRQGNLEEYWDPNPPLRFPNLTKLRAPIGDDLAAHVELETLFSSRRNWQIGDPGRGEEEEDPHYKRLEFHAILPSDEDTDGLAKLEILQRAHGDQIVRDKKNVTFHRWDDDKEWPCGEDEWIDHFL